MFACMQKLRFWVVVFIISVFTLKAFLSFSGIKVFHSSLVCADSLWTTGAINDTSEGTPLKAGGDRGRSRLSGIMAFFDEFEEHLDLSESVLWSTACKETFSSDNITQDSHPLVIAEIKKNTVSRK